MQKLYTLIKVRQWELDERRKELVALETEQSEVQQQQQALAADIEAQKNLAQQDIQLVRAFSAYYRVATKRRDALQTEYDTLAEKIDLSRETVRDAFNALKKYELVEEMRVEQEQTEQDLRETAALDEIALTQYRHRRAHRNGPQDKPE